jgi:peptidoglycan/LPS O-acetylase OafA/YrhL
MTQRIEQLDSLRGLAAVTVVLHHFTELFPGKVLAADPWWNLLVATPLGCIVAGHQAVVFFFVLSGFVLFLPFARHSVAYLPWIIKRICRICLPYYSAIALAVLLITICRPEPIAALTPWFNRTFQGPVTSAAIVNHLALVGDFRNNQFDPVVWSLVIEMRISLIFPLIAAMVIALGWRKSLVAAYLAAGVGVAVYFLLNYRLAWRNDYYTTFLYVPAFVVGCILARHQQQIIPWFRRLSRSTKALALAAGILLYTYSLWLLPNVGALHLPPIDDLFTTLGVVIFIVFALSTSSAASILLSRPLVLLGKASYSLYLVHAICLLAAVHALFGRLAMGWILAIAAAATVVMTIAMYWAIEIPSIELGRRLSGLLSARKEGRAVPVPDLREP